MKIWKQISKNWGAWMHYAFSSLLFLRLLLIPYYLIFHQYTYSVHEDPPSTDGDGTLWNIVNEMNVDGMRWERSYDGISGVRYEYTFEEMEHVDFISNKLFHFLSFPPNSKPAYYRLYEIHTILQRTTQFKLQTQFENLGIWSFSLFSVTKV